MSLYDEASTPNSSIPNVGRRINGTVSRIGPARLAAEIPTFPGVNVGIPNSLATRAPRASDGETGRYDASIVRRVDLGAPSVLTTIFKATPVANITGVARELPAIQNRPLLPLGLTERAVEALPAGMKARAANWSRLLARLASKRPTLPVSRE